MQSSSIVLCVAIVTAAATTARAGDGVEITARVSPIASSTYKLHEEDAALGKTLRLDPVTPSVEHPIADFTPFLPKDGVAIGKTWRVAPDAALPFLRQIHPGATFELEINGFNGGTFACLLGKDDAKLDVLIRSHAEFRLDGGKTRYTPAQFEGRLVWDRAAKRPLAFRLAVEDGLDVDKGRLKLRREFYAAAKLDWMPFADAIARATEEQKTIHLMILFGTFDDESC